MTAKNIVLAIDKFKRDSLVLRNICFLGFCFLLPGIALDASATNYYVSPSGNDASDGTLASPFKTIQKGVTKLKSGDILYVRTGKYVERVTVEQSGTEFSPVTIMSYPGESPVIDGEGRLPDKDWADLLQIEGDYVNVSGFEIKNSNTNGTHLGGGGIAIYGQHSKVSNMNVHHIWSTGVLAAGDYSIVENCRVWQTALSNSVVHVSKGWDTGLSAARSPVDGITTNAILRGNIVYDNWGEGLSSFEAEGTIIEDNIVYDNWSVNLYISDTRDALIQRNIVYNTPNNEVGQRRPFTLGDERADKPRSANTVVINNFIYNADFWAFWSSDVPGSGLDNVIIANNTIVNGKFEIGNDVYDGTINKSAVIKNNIFYTDNGDPWEIMGSLDKLVFSNNLWSASPPSGPMASASDVIGDPQLAKTGNTGAGELTADYFKILITSPAINAGTQVSAVTRDFFENLRDAAPDIGANEYIFPDQAIAVTGITVTGAGGVTTIGTKNGILQLSVSVLPVNATNKSVFWSVQNGTGQALISQGGLLTAIDDGTVTAIATSGDGSGVQGFLSITIENQIVTATDVQLGDQLLVTFNKTELIVQMNKEDNYKYLTIYNLFGKRVFNGNLVDNKSAVNISDLSSGVYIVSLSNEKGNTKTFKVCKP
jgi:uncharacterized protein YjdB